MMEPTIAFPQLADLRTQIMSAILGEVRWEDFLESLCDLLPNGAATLFYHDASVDRGAFSLASGLDRDALKAYSEHYCALNPWMEAATRRPIGLSVPDDAMLDRKALVKTEFYNDYLLPNDLQGAVGVTIERKDRCHFFLSILGDMPGKSVEPDVLITLRTLVPDLRRAFEFYNRRKIPNDIVADTATKGNMTLGPRRFLRTASGEASRQLELGYLMSVGPTGRVDFRDKRIARHLDVCLAAACTQTTTPTARVFLASQPRGMPLKLTVLTWPWADGMRYFRGPECLVLLETPPQSPPDMTEFSGFFGLTAREAMIAAALSTGQSPRDIATAFGTSFETVRSHVRSIFSKTGTRRQPELVRLLAHCVE